MPKEAENISVDLGFENLMNTIYGRNGHPCVAGHTSVRSWKKGVLQLFRTLKTAILKNVNGDDPYRNHLMERCDVAISAIKSSKYKDAIVCDALQFGFETLFSLLGRFPNNWQTRRAHHSHVTGLADYRTFSYVRTARQKAKQITDAAYYNRTEDGDPDFDTLITKLRREFRDDPEKFLTWLRAEHRKMYDRFI